MAVTALIGMQWGDEGKGKIIDILAKDYDYIVRFNGGDNAGHTIKVGDKKFGLHLVPSGVFYPEKIKIIGNGVVINPETLLKEIAEVEAAGLSLDKLYISNRAHIILQWHKTLDGIEDEGNTIGTTKRGIGPTYQDKAGRTHAIRVCDLLDKQKLKEKLARTAKLKEKIIAAYGKTTVSAPFNVEELYASLCSFADKIRPRVVDAAYVLNDAVKDKKTGKRVLLEGAQGTLLDVDHGTYPYVTSSNIVSGAGATGSGIAPTKIDKVIGIVKAYTTRVGSGPFPTELKDELGEKIRQKGAEFGTTTGRPRRCGWLDMVALKYAAMLNGTTHIIITKIDVLDGLNRIKVCTGYEIDSTVTTQFPASADALERIKPMYKSFKGWSISEEEWNKAKETKTIPEQCKRYLSYIKKELKVKIAMLSYGPARDETIVF